MGNTWGSKIGSGNSFAQTGEGRSMPPGTLPKYASVSYRSWRQGMMAFLSPENTPEDAGRDVLDIMIDKDDSLIRPPGLTEVDDVTPRLLRWLFQHASLDYSTELVAIDAPYMGYKGSGAFVFVNAGIAAPGLSGWNAVNILGVLIFSDGSTVTYAREFNAAVVIDISADIIARTFANIFGRTFAGAFNDPVDGFQGLGVKWTGTSGLYTDWSGTGSGEELLISNSLDADKIVALRPIGFDALGILCRNSIWIGYPTQQADRPADFRIRQVGIGCVAEPTAVVFPDGIAFLSDDGVMIFNQNELKNISEQINAVLLPIDYTQLSRYRMVYDPTDNTLRLQTPTGTWVYELPRPPIHDGRWTQRSFSLDNLVLFTDQSGNLFWGTVAGTWNSQALSWNEMVVSQEDAPSTLYAASGSKLAVEDSSAEDYLGIPMDSHWETRNTPTETEDGPSITEQVTTVGFELEYKSNAVAEIELRTPDINGDFTNVLVQSLASTAGKRRRVVVWNTTTGQGTKLQYAITAGQLSLYSIKQITIDSGPAVNSAQ
jgi:hypothetical protein